MKIFYFILVILFALFIVIFSKLNEQPVTINLYYRQIDDVPTYMLIFFALLAGVIITWFLGVVERFRLNRTINRLNKTIRDMRKEMRVNEPPPIIDEARTL
jgi:lipopolysaccharide assembly protein A